MPDKICRFDENLRTAEIKKNMALESVKRAKAVIDDLEDRAKRLTEVKQIIQTVAKDTQANLEEHISSVCSIALESIFEDPYEFKLAYEIKRNRTEARLVLIKDGEEIEPMHGAGGGVVDIVAFALRIALLLLSNNSKVIILDEPFRFLSKDLQPKAGIMLSQLSENLGIQFIMVTHNEAFVEKADTVIEVSQGKGVSQVN